MSEASSCMHTRAVASSNDVTLCRAQCCPRTTQCCAHSCYCVLERRNAVRTHAVASLCCCVLERRNTVPDAMLSSNDAMLCAVIHAVASSNDATLCRHVALNPPSPCRPPIISFIVLRAGHQSKLGTLPWGCVKAHPP